MSRGCKLYNLSYILHRRGAFDVARFDKLGNARAFIAWSERQDRLHVFLVCLFNFYFMLEKLQNAVRLSLFMTITLLCANLDACAQVNLIERRVYYLDATYSMVSNKLWESSKDNLIRAIENIDDVNTELIIVVFADDKNPAKKIWGKWEKKATTLGKQELIRNIKRLTDPIRSSMTNLYDPWMDFYSEAKPDRVNYMFLMTDGGHEQGGDFFSAIDQWKNRTDTLTYGFFVELTDKVGATEVKARNKARQHIDSLQGHRLWRVSTADVNINLIRLEQCVTYNVRGDKYIDIPIFFSGKDSAAIEDLEFKFANNADFEIKKVDSSKDAVRVYIDNHVDIFTYPTNSIIPLSVKINSKDGKTFLLTNSVNIKCLNKKEKKLSFFDSQIRGKVKHYDSFWWVKANTTPCIAQIDLEFNQEALNDKETFVEFVVVDNNGTTLPPSSINLALDSVPCKDNKIRVKTSDKKLSLSISFPDGTEPGIYQGYLKPVNYHLDRIGNIELNASSSEYPIMWRIKYIHSMNPLARALMQVCICILSALLFWFLILKPVKYPCFPKFRKMVLVKKNGTVVTQFSVNFKGARKVVFADKKQPQRVLNKLFTGRIDTVVNPIFGEPIIFFPRKGRKAMAIGRGYLFRPNPIPQSGVAEICEPTQKLIINLQ